MILSDAEIELRARAYRMLRTAMDRAMKTPPTFEAYLEAVAPLIDRGRRTDRQHPGMYHPFDTATATIRIVADERARQTGQQIVV